MPRETKQTAPTRRPKKGRPTRVAESSGLFVVDLKETNARAFVLFVQTAELVLKYADAALVRAGLSLIKLMVLQVLQSHGGTLTPSQIAHLTMREKHAITTLLRRLQRDRFITVTRSVKDRRSFNVTITEEGKRAISRVSPAARKIVDQVMSEMREQPTLNLEKLLKALRENAYAGLLAISKG
jgi:DNA-binding MarR family transcriptional regulator